MRKHLLLLATVVIVASATPLLGQGNRPATPVEVVNTPTVAISPTANTVKIEGASVVDPALTPYYFVATSLNCPFVNECIAQGPAVPVGKRLRVTNITGFLPAQTATNAFVYFPEPSTDRPLVAFPATPQGFAFFGNSISFSHEINFFLEAGQQPEVRLGTSGQIVTSNPRVTITGYLVEVTP